MSMRKYKCFAIGMVWYGKVCGGYCQFRPQPPAATGAPSQTSTIPWVCYRRRNQWLRLALALFCPIPYHTRGGRQHLKCVDCMCGRVWVLFFWVGFQPRGCTHLRGSAVYSLTQTQFSGASATMAWHGMVQYGMAKEALEWWCPRFIKTITNGKLGRFIYFTDGYP